MRWFVYDIVGTHCHGDGAQREHEGANQGGQQQWRQQRRWHVLTSKENTCSAY